MTNFPKEVLIITEEGDVKCGFGFTLQTALQYVYDNYSPGMARYIAAKKGIKLIVGDIVERLRECAGPVQDVEPFGLLRSPMLHEAADEIERLQGQVHALQLSSDKYWMED